MMPDRPEPRPASSIATRDVLGTARRASRTSVNAAGTSSRYPKCSTTAAHRMLVRWSTPVCRYWACVSFSYGIISRLAQVSVPAPSSESAPPIRRNRVCGLRSAASAVVAGSVVVVMVRVLPGVLGGCCVLGKTLVRPASPIPGTAVPNSRARPSLPFARQIADVAPQGGPWRPDRRSGGPAVDGADAELPGARGSPGAQTDASLADHRPDDAGRAAGVRSQPPGTAAPAGHPALAGHLPAQG